MATIDGTNLEDDLYDTSGDDLITAYAGGDQIFLTSGGNDTVYGGNGTDLIIADTGTDKVWGGNQGDIFTFASWDTGSADILMIRDFNAADGDVLAVQAGTEYFDIDEVTLLGEASLQITVNAAYSSSGNWLSQTFQLVGFTLADYTAAGGASGMFEYW